MGTSDPLALQLREIQAEVGELRALLGPNPNIEGAPLYVYGHSWTMHPNPYSTPYTGEYQSRVASRLRLGQVSNNGHSGTKMPEVLAGAIAPTYAGRSRHFKIGSRGIVVLQALINDISSGSNTADDPLYKETFKRSLRAFLAWVSAGTWHPVTSATSTGTWVDTSETAAAMYPNGMLKHSRVAGSQLSWTVTGDEAWVWCMASDPTMMSGGAWTATVGGTAVGSFTAQGAVKAFNTVAGVNRRDMAVAIRLTGLDAAAGTSGSKTLTLTKEVDGQDTYIAGVSIPSPNPPRVYVAKEAPFNPAASAASVARFNERAPAYHQIIESVVGEFRNAHVVDMAEGWDNATMIASLDKARCHPNDLGMERLAATLSARIRETLTTPDPGVLTL